MQDIIILKRDNQKVPFDGTKIAIAIKKGFDSVPNQTEASDAANGVFLAVLDQIKEISEKEAYLSIEHIQDLIERELLRQKYTDVYESFSAYRARRNQSRHAFMSKQHKFMKAIESLNQSDAIDVDAKRENANVDGNAPMGMMLQFGSTVSKEFATSYLLDPEFAAAHDQGRIHIHDLDFYAMGTTTCCQIDLQKLFKHGFSTGHGFLRAPKDIMSYTALAAIAIQSNQNDQHGGQSIPAFDYYMAPGVLMTFKKQFKQRVYDYIEVQGLLNDVDMPALLNHINDVDSITLDITPLQEIAPQAADAIAMAYDKALRVTDRITYQSMEAFIHNLNTMHSRAGAQVPFSSINFGTDTSPEGRMVIENYLDALNAGLGQNETPIFPISVFKLKRGVNFNLEDPNYDLFKLAMQVSAKRLFPNFSFLDSSFNLPFYKEDNFETEATYMGCRTRVMSDIFEPGEETVTGRGNISFTSVNLVRLGIQHGIYAHKQPQIDAFYEALGETMDLVAAQILARYEHQISKSKANFSFLLGQGVWKYSEALSFYESPHASYRHGSLAIGFIGLAECLKALIGFHHGESNAAQVMGLEIIQFMRDRIDAYTQEYQMNFSLIATPAEGLAGRFLHIDRSIYGVIPGVTDKAYYTNSFHVPVYYDISIKDKIRIEGAYHALTNGGHITYVELDGDTTKNIDAFESVIRCMAENDIGYGAINHPVDRDPVCGYTGIINDVCPHCGRSEDEHQPNFERIRRITGYLVGTLDRFNDAKRQETQDRTTHK